MIRKTEEFSQSEVSAKEFVQLIRDAWARNVVVVESFGGRDAFNSTLDKIEALDQRFQAGSGVYFHLGSSPAETVQRNSKKHRSPIVKLAYARVFRLKSRTIWTKSAPAGKIPTTWQAVLALRARAELEHASHP